MTQYHHIQSNSTGHDDDGTALPPFCRGSHPILRAIYKAGEEAAYDTFRKMRCQDTDGEALCPRCGHDDAHDIATRRKFKCKACHHQFNVTWGTIFASRKVDFVDLLAAVCILVNASEGISAVQLSRDLDCQYETDFVLAHKLREAMA